jgi:hypothetical protein
LAFSRTIALSGRCAGSTAAGVATGVEVRVVAADVEALAAPPGARPAITSETVASTATWRRARTRDDGLGMAAPCDVDDRAVSATIGWRVLAEH